MPATSFLEEIATTTADEFLNVLKPTNPLWGRGWDTPWVFRGHADAGWSLLPPARRHEGLRHVLPVAEKLIESFNGWSFERLAQVMNDPELVKRDERTRMAIEIVQENAEQFAIMEFVRLADELGLHVGELPASVSEHPTPAVAFAQHHGIPTSLLDWTRRPAVAAYFATCEEQTAPYVAVWALNARVACSSADVVGGQSLHAYQCPRSSHAFLHAQDGLFTWSKPNRWRNYLLSRGRWPTVIDILECEYGSATSPLLRKVTLPRVQVDAVQRLLWRERVSRAHLMPTFDNVSAALMARWKREVPAVDGTGLPPPVVWIAPQGNNPLLTPVPEAQRSVTCPTARLPESTTPATQKL